MLLYDVFHINNTFDKDVALPARPGSKISYAVCKNWDGHVMVADAGAGKWRQVAAAEWAVERAARSDWDQMKPQTVKLCHSSELFINATVDVLTAEPLVCLDSDWDLLDGVVMRPVEAERLARSLLKGAKIARALRAPKKKRMKPSQRRKAQEESKEIES